MTCARSVAVLEDIPVTAVLPGAFPALEIGAARLPAVAYTSYLPTSALYRKAADAGIRLFCFPAYLGDRGINLHSGIGPFRKGIWRSEQDFDFSDIETDFESLLSACPDAFAIMRLHLDPPAWWERAHLEGCCIRNDGSTLRQCFASEEWRRATESALRIVLRWIIASPYARRLAGVHLAAGQTEEWFYHLRGSYEDGNPDRAAAFRAWLRQRYRGLPALRSAWRCPEADFETAAPADIGRPAAAGAWRDTERDAAILDTFRFQAETIAAAIARFCRVVKEESGRRLLTGAFYGYHFFVADPRWGHGALGRLLRSPDLDYLASPNSYDRRPGEDWAPMAAIDSVRLHGKLWMAEHDTRTSRTTLLKDMAPDICPAGQYEEGVWLGPGSLATSAMLLRNNAARMLTRGYGGWWFDMWGGWFDDPALMAEIAAAQSLAGALIAGQRAGDALAPQMAVFSDEELCFHDSTCGSLAAPLLGNRLALGRMGRPYLHFLRSDLARAPRSGLKCAWLLGWPSLGPDEALLREWSAAGIGLLWTDLRSTRLLPAGGGAWAEACSGVSPDAVLLGELVSRCGVHRYLDTGDVVYAGNGLLAIHAAASGRKHIRLPGPMRIEAIRAPAMRARTASGFSVELGEHETAVYRVTPARNPSPTFVDAALRPEQGGA